MTVPRLQLHQLENAFDIDQGRLTRQILRMNGGVKLAGGLHHIFTRAQM
jgi:hypothetical protein